MHRFTVPFLLVAIVLMSVVEMGLRPSVVAQEATPTADLEANKALARRWQELFTQGNLDIVDEILTADFVWRTPPPYVAVRGRTGVKAEVTETRAFLHDLELTEEDVIAEGDPRPRADGGVCHRGWGPGRDPVEPTRHGPNRLRALPGELHRN
jgi:hypothetical protein